MTAQVIQLRPDQGRTADEVLAEFQVYLDRCSLAHNSKITYGAQAGFYVDWLNAVQAVGEHLDAFTDQIGADSAVTDWKRDRLEQGKAATTANLGIDAVTLMYEQVAKIVIKPKRVPEGRRPAPPCLSRADEAALKRTAVRHGLREVDGHVYQTWMGVRNVAIILLFLESGARVQECARLTLDDVVLSARTGHVRLLGKGDRPRTIKMSSAVRDSLRKWLLVRARLMRGREDHGKLWLGRRDHVPLSRSAIIDVVRVLTIAAGIGEHRPHILRHTFAHRLREAGKHLTEIQELMGHASIETTALYTRASQAEVDGVIDDVFG